MNNTLRQNLIQPILAMRVRYLPLLAIYFAYGCSAFSGIAESFFVKEHLNLSAEALLMIGVWVSIPWTIKMVFGQFADSVPLFGSVRRSYVILAGLLMAFGSILMAGLAGRWPWVTALGSDNAIFIASSLVTIIGVVLQDVVADAMSVEVVEREGRDEHDINSDLAMVQLLGRLALMFGMFLVAGLGGWLAQVFSYEAIFLMTLIIPVIGVSGCLLIKIDKPVIKPINWTVLGGGLIYAVFVLVMGLSEVPYGQEIVFVVSLGIVIFLLRSLVGGQDTKIIKTLIGTAIVIFMFRATPSAGAGAQWFMIDVLGFDKAFFGMLSQIGAGLAIASMWFFAKPITQKPIALVLAVLTIVYFFLSFPLISLYYGFHHWTALNFGFGARTIALVDTALSSPFAQLAMVPMLALIARHAPKGNAATWFALMASFMNLALTGGTLMSKYLNQVFVVTRQVLDAKGAVAVPADYSQLGMLLITVAVISLLMPLVAIAVFMRKKKRAEAKLAGA